MNIAQLICKLSSCFPDHLTLSEHACSSSYRGLGRKWQKTGRFVKTLTDRELQRIREKSRSVKKHNRPTYA